MDNLRERYGDPHQAGRPCPAAVELGQPGESARPPDRSPRLVADRAGVGRRRVARAGGPDVSLWHRDGRFARGRSPPTRETRRDAAGHEPGDRGHARRRRSSRTWPSPRGSGSSTTTATRDKNPPPTEAMCGGVGLLDYDGDGWLDVYVVQGGSFPPTGSPLNDGDRLFRNRGDGRFEDVNPARGDRRLPRRVWSRRGGRRL